MLKPLTLALTLMTALNANAQMQFNRPEDAVKYRQSGMFLQSYHLGRLAAMVNGRIPYDAKAALEHATLVDLIDRLPYGAFVEGTSDRGNSRAKPEIWSDLARFDGMVTKLHEESAKLVAAARAGTLEQLRPAVGAVGQACKACHDVYQRN